MKKPVSALAVLVAAWSCTAAFAQEAPLRGVGLLALNTSEPSSHSTLVEPSDGGGGTVGARALRGGDGMRPGSGQADDDDGASADALPAKAGTPADPAPPVSAPRRPSYRWQSLVPGAIK
jgi:hypothetical protein